MKLPTLGGLRKQADGPLDDAIRADALKDILTVGGVSLAGGLGIRGLLGARYMFGRRQPNFRRAAGPTVLSVPTPVYDTRRDERDALKSASQLLSLLEKSAAPIPQPSVLAPGPLPGTKGPPIAGSPLSIGKPLAHNYSGLELHESPDKNAPWGLQALPAGGFGPPRGPGGIGSMLLHKNGPTPDASGQSLLQPNQGALREIELTQGKPTPEQEMQRYLWNENSKNFLRSDKGLPPALPSPPPTPNAATAKPFESPKPFNPNTVRPTMLPDRVGISKEAEAPPLTARNQLPWYYPGMLLASIGGLYGGYKAMDALADRKRKMDLQSEVDDAQEDYRTAIMGQYNPTQVASKEPVVSQPLPPQTINAPKGVKKMRLKSAAFQDDLEKLSSIVESNPQSVGKIASEKAAFLGLDRNDANKALGIYGAFALPLMLGSGILAYRYSRDRSSNKLTEDAIKARERERWTSRPPEVYAVPTPVRMTGGRLTPKNPMVEEET